MLKKILVWAIVIGVLATIINDVGRYFSTWRTAEDAATEAALQAAGAARGNRDRNRAWVAVVNECRKTGTIPVNVRTYDDGVEVWVDGNVQGTWALGPILQASKGVWDTDTWWTTPILVHSDATNMY